MTVHGTLRLCMHLELTQGVPQDTDWTVNPQAHTNLRRQSNGIDCGLYAMLIPELVIAGNSLSVLTPTVAQQARLYTANCLLNGRLGDLLIYIP